MERQLYRYSQHVYIGGVKITISKFLDALACPKGVGGAALHFSNKSAGGNGYSGELRIK